MKNKRNQDKHPQDTGQRMDRRQNEQRATREQTQDKDFARRDRDQTRTNREQRRGRDDIPID